MKYQEIIPREQLKPYIKCYYIYESDASIEFEDTVFPSGLMEMIFNLGEGTWETLVNDKFQTTPKIELWGQIINPLPIKSKGRNTMFGIKFFPHTAAYFLKDEITVFNNLVSDLTDVFDSSVKNLHERLLETPGLKGKIEFVEKFFTKRLPVNENASHRIKEVGHILSDMEKNYSDENIEDIAIKHGISPRYLHKLVSQYTGLSPKFHNKINRFQQSLKLITDNNNSLTSIAYDCGYFDQSHFIKDFKSFTGFTPSAYLKNKFPVNQSFLQ
jgi:AraC-like DNA-binding protein